MVSREQLSMFHHFRLRFNPLATYPAFVANLLPHRWRDNTTQAILTVRGYQSVAIKEEIKSLGKCATEVYSTSV